MTKTCRQCHEPLKPKKGPERQFCNHRCMGDYMKANPNKRKQKPPIAPVVDGERQCYGENSCGEWYPLNTNFFNSNGHGGHDRLCRDCRSIYRRERYKARYESSRRATAQTANPNQHMINVRGEPLFVPFEPPHIPWSPSQKKDGIYGMFGGTPTLKQAAKQAELTGNQPPKAQVVSIRSVAA